MKRLKHSTLIAVTIAALAVLGVVSPASAQDADTGGIIGTVEFRDAYREHTRPGMTFDIDLGNTEYMDSSALGMLLVLKEHADEHDGQVRVVRASANARRVLSLCNLDQIFQIPRN